MSEESNQELRQRVTKLEERLGELEQQLQAEQHEYTASSKESAADSKSSKKTAIDAVHKITDEESERFQFDERWLYRIGIALLLIGVAFLFKYSVDQGWLIPPVRSAFGLGIGAALFFGGLQMGTEKSPLKQILTGGGIAAFYITGFATFQLYSFLPGAVIWGFMVVVTLLALSLSLQQDEALLSVVGTLGALGTPFMLYSGSGNVSLLMAYVMLVLIAAIIIYAQKGWRALLWTYVLGGATVIFIGIVSSVGYSTTERWMFQTASVVWIAGAWFLPVLRNRAGLLTFQADELNSGSAKHTSGNSTVHFLIVFAPLFLLLIESGAWGLSSYNTGIVAIIIAAAGGAMYLQLNRRHYHSLASTHLVMALGMATLGIVLLLEQNVLFMVLTLEAVALRYITHKTDNKILNVAAHILFMAIVLWDFQGLLDATSSAWTFRSVTQLCVIIAGGWFIPLRIKKDDLKKAYRIVSHVLFLIWIYQKVVVFNNGQAWVSVIWGVYAVLLLIAGFSQYGKSVRIVGMGTLFLVIAKLFIIDLSQLKAIWRILLFLGFGSVLLLVGYYSQSQMLRQDKQQ